MYIITDGVRTFRVPHRFTHCINRGLARTPRHQVPTLVPCTLREVANCIDDAILQMRWDEDITEEDWRVLSVWSSAMHAYSGEVKRGTHFTVTEEG